MVFDSSIQNQRTRDNLGSEPDVQPIVKVKQETITLHETPLLIFSGDVSSSSALILDNSTYGKWDTGRVWASDTSDISQDLLQVINSNNTFNESFNIISDVQGTNNRYTQYTLVDLTNTTATLASGSVTF